MKICMWGAAVLLLTGTVARAADGVGAGRRTEVSVSSAESLAAETALASTLFPTGTDPSRVTSDWQRFRQGCLWDDYCLQRQGAAAVCLHAASCPEEHHASWFRVLWPWRSAPMKPCRTCHQRRTPALDALCNLLGWERRTTYRVACHERIDCQEPVGSVHFDDPAPSPPAAPPLMTPDESLGDVNTEIDPRASASPPVEPVPVPEETLDPNGAPNEMELSPAPADDPAPEPQPGIPRNKLPKPQPTNPDTSRATSGRTVVAVRLSDYIRTR